MRGAGCGFGGARLAVASLVALALTAPGGCGGLSRPVLSEPQLVARANTTKERAREVMREIVGSALERADRRLRSPDTPKPLTLDILVVSGGGDYGAFGAGLFSGWGEVADPDWRRPDFDIVTGVSTGALLAPFAYVGTDEACARVEHLYRNPKPDWIRERGLLFFLPSNASFMELPGLERDVRAEFDQDLVDQMAAQARKGKVLVTSATDLDFGRQFVWNIGEEAIRAQERRELDRVHRILLASAAIPAVFPPVEIDGSLYADGAVTSNVLVRLDPRSKDAFIVRWRELHPDVPLPRVRYWVVINNQLRQPPATVQPRWPEIAPPALAIAVRSATIAELRWLSAQADFVNSTLNADVEVRVIAIPDDWRPPVPGLFKKETMNSLADVGRRMGADPHSWQLWASPELAAGAALSPTALDAGR